MSTAIAERDNQAPALTPAQKQKARLDSFMGAVEKRQDQLSTLLSDSGVDPKLFLEACRRALMRDPDLVNTDPAAFIQAALNCAADGLIPDGRKAAIVRYKSAAQYVPMYQGLLDIAYRSGNFQSIEARVVYKGDDFDYDLGDDPFIRHKRSLEATSEKIIGAYAIARTTNGGVFREVMGLKDLAKVRAVSKATNGPNKDWPGEMARKAPVRRLWKYLPKTAAMDRVAIHDDDTYDQTALGAVGDAPRKLQPGFNPPALTHQPAEEITPTVDQILDGDNLPAFADAEDAEVEDFPGDRQQTAQEPQQQAATSPAAPTLAQKADAYEERLRAATNTTKLKAIYGAAAGLRRDLDDKDPERLAEVDALFSARFTEVEEAEREAAQ